MTPTIQAVAHPVAPQGGGLSIVARPGVAQAPAATAMATATAPPVVASTGADATDSALEAAREWMDRRAQEAGAELEFRIDEDSGRVVVSVLDRGSGEVLRQIPSEEALRIARHLQQHQDRGALIAALA